MVHLRAARIILLSSVIGLTIAVSPTAAGADDGGCNRGKDASACAPACAVEKRGARGRGDDGEDGDDRDELRRHRNESGTRRSNTGHEAGHDDVERDDVGRDDAAEHDGGVDLDDDCLPPAVVPEATATVLLPASAAGVLIAFARITRRRRLRTA